MNGTSQSPDVPAHKPARVAVWGLGEFVRCRILPALSIGRRTLLVGMTSRNQDVLLAEAGRFGCRAWSDPEEMLSCADVDAVYLATPIGVHHKLGKRVLESGKHLWCEKALTTRHEETLELVELARRHDLGLCEAFSYPFHPQFTRLRELLTNALGNVFSVVSCFGMPTLEKPGFRNDPALGGGARLDVGAYPVSLMLQITLEEPKLRLVRLDWPFGAPVDHGGVAVFEAPSGTLFHLEWGFGRAYLNEVRAWGEAGWLCADKLFTKARGLRAEIHVGDRRGTVRTERFEPSDQFENMLEAFQATLHDRDLRQKEVLKLERQSRYLDALARGP